MKKLLSIAFASLLLATSAFAQSIANYDVLGVKLGMSEREARAALASFKPADAGNNPVVIQDFKIKPNGATQDVRAGFKVGIQEQKGADVEYPRVIVLLYNDKVWAVWRRDIGRYPVASTEAAVEAKYPGVKMATSYGRRVGTAVEKGAEPPRSKGSFAYTPPQENCGTAPFVNGGRNIMLGSLCKKFFQIDYSRETTNGVDTLVGGEAQLADEEVGRAFFASVMNAAAAQQQKNLSKPQF